MWGNGLASPRFRGLGEDNAAEQRDPDRMSFACAVGADGVMGRGVACTTCPGRMAVSFSPRAIRAFYARLRRATEKVGMRGRFRESELVEAPPHRTEIWFLSARVALSPQAGRGKR
jgi:hypothetical protein